MNICIKEDECGFEYKEDLKAKLEKSQVLSSYFKL